ncbi:MAG TPA: DUF5658 family protein [Methylomirabilota bacterium]|nr:DUF5658 family protein [Methylomirabilota bacterium]
MSQHDRPRVERRTGQDRRRRPTGMLSAFLLWGCRRGGRRQGERSRIYVDRPAPGLVAASWLVVVLSAADAYLSVSAMAETAIELNPLMGAALAAGPVVFGGVKLVLTGIGAAFLCLHGTWTLGRAGLLSAVVVYVFVLVYHVYGHAGVIQVP